MKISILIPVKKDNKNLRECVEHCLKLDYSDFEIIVLPDEMLSLPYGNKIQIIPTGIVNPAQKRDIGIEYARGEIIAFLDDDAYPTENWLKNATENFKDPKVAAVGGPAVTCPEDNPRQKASGLVYGSTLVSGKFVYRYLPKEKREVDDFPSCNLLVRKSILQELGGFKTQFWPGEDTFLCLEIMRKLGKKIIYDPKVIVYHHRRPLFLPHLKQVSNYALHRGYFVKKFPDTSFRFNYFIPSIFILGLIGGGILAMISPVIGFFYRGIMGIYVMLVTLASLRVLDTKCQGRSNPKGGIFVMMMVFIGIILTHLTYGIYFIKGLFLRRLAEE